MVNADILFNVQILRAWKNLGNAAELMFPGFDDAERLTQTVIAAMEAKVQRSEDPEHYGGFARVELDEETVEKMKSMRIERRGQKVSFIQLSFDTLSLEYPPTK